MAICVGDTVRFLNEVGGGKVTRIKDNTAYVLTEEGFEIPINISQLVVINKNSVEKTSENEEKTPEKNIKQNDFLINYNYAEREETTFEDELIENKYDKKDEEKKVVNEENKSSVENYDKIFIAFVPENNKKDGEDGVSVYLINDSDFILLYSIGITEGNKHALLDAGEAESYEKINISKIAKETYPALKSITIQAIKYKKGIYKTENVINEELKIKSFKLLTDSTFKNNEYFDLPAWVIQLGTDFIDDKKEKQTIKNMSDIIFVKETEEPDLSKKYTKRPEPILLEVDLHINQLIDSTVGLSHTEMLNIQLSKFRSELESAIKNKENKIVFIHGIGNGTLKMAIRKELDDLYKHLQYQDASFKEYGYGATMVLLRKGNII
ncbi:MAG: hypothetical protein COS14_08995 [Bacteroidetes bacterium CG02_land_8_20_14_3_00_31_25]|nr:DUF2027 domain-containing protein [Bacteroidota bacterium]PIV58558.1 MAG: hypothetical protein COS14_08995 [Bacteroidetes bacterium CG02_land_8_20_14_3_00_31_25]